MEHEAIEVLQIRVRKLERLMKLSTVAWVLAAVLLTVLVLTLQQVTVRQRILRGQGIEIVDGAGHQRMRMGMTRDGASVLRFYDGTQKERLGLFVAQSGAAGLVLFGAGEHQRAALTVLKAGTPQFLLNDDRGKELFAAP